MTIEWVEIGKLIPNPKNPNKHSEAQIEALSEIITFQGWRSPIVVDKNMMIWAGHGRLLAAKKLKLQKVPVHIQEFQSEEQAYAFLVSDNAIASWAELDLSAINYELPNLGPDFDIHLLGIKDFELEPADKLPKEEKDEVSSKKTETIECPNCQHSFTLKSKEPKCLSSQESLPKLSETTSKNSKPVESVPIGKPLPSLLKKRAPLKKA